MIKRLDDLLLGEIKQPIEHAKRFTICDSLLRNFYVVIGSRSIAFYCRIITSNKRKSVNLGRYPITGTNEARLKAIALLTGQQQPNKPLNESLETITTSSETLSELLARYHSSRKLAEATKKSMVATFRQGLSDWLDKPATNLTPKRFEVIYRRLFMDGRESSARMLGRYTRAIYRWNGLIDPTSGLYKNTGESMGKVVARDRRIEQHQLADFKRVMPQLTEQQQLSIMVALCSGMRKSELQSVTPSSLDHATKSIKLAKTKNGKPHQIPIPHELWQQLIEASKEKAADSPILTIGDKLPRMLTDKIPLSWHDCRRTCASTLIMLNESESLVKALLNHSGGSVTQVHYLRFDREQIRKAVEKLADYFNCN